jgi:hypothetical protein
MTLRVFTSRELSLALEHARRGEIAIHLHGIVSPDAPACFRHAIERGEQIAHLFCRDRDHLVLLARTLGVRRVVVDRAGTDRQHVDLVGAPLRRALALARREQG